MHRIVKLVVILMLLASAQARAQSLNAAAPAPLQPGTNRGSVDNMTGAHYWYFVFNPGKADIKIHALNFSGTTHSITLHVYDEKKTWHIDRQLTEQQPDFNSPGAVKSATKIILEISPPGAGVLFGNLTRSGADYELEVTGSVRYAAKASGDPICRVYQDMSGQVLHGMCKFLPNGTIQCSDGTTGTWKVFDADSHLYIVTLPDRGQVTVKHVIGVGLLDTTSNFQNFKELK